MTSCLHNPVKTGTQRNLRLFINEMVHSKSRTRVHAVNSFKSLLTPKATIRSNCSKTLKITGICQHHAVTEHKVI